MKKTSLFVISLTLLFSSLCGEIAPQFSSYVPDGVEVHGGSLRFTRHFQLHNLHWRLCQEAKKAHQDGDESINNLRQLFLEWDGTPYVMDDQLEDHEAKGALDLSRELALLSNDEQPMTIHVEKIDYRQVGFAGKKQEITQLLSDGFCDNWFYSLDVWFSAWMRQPIIFLAYNTSSNYEPVGMLWATPTSNVLIHSDDGTSTYETVWNLQSICCLPQYVGMGICSTLMQALKEDPEIHYSCLQVAKDNQGAYHCYHKQGFQPTPHPKTELGLVKPYEIYQFMVARLDPSNPQIWAIGDLAD